MDEQTRSKLQEELAELDKAERAVREAMKPFDTTLTAIETVRENLREKHDADIAGDCEGCGRMLLTGELGHRCNDGPILCEKCSPTWADAKTQWEKGERLENEADDRECFNAAYEAHIASGGSPGDRITHEL